MEKRKIWERRETSKASRWTKRGGKSQAAKGKEGGGVRGIKKGDAARGRVFQACVPVNYHGRPRGCR